MKHEPYFRIHKDAEVAVLFIHGIVGTPNHFRDFVKLVPEYNSVANVLLYGHGKAVDDFAKASMDKWNGQISQTIDELSKNHTKIVIVAHSMGTLFAIRQAIKKPNQITALFLLASPLKIRVRLELFTRVLKIYLNRVKPTDIKTVAARDAYGIEHDFRFWKYLSWIPVYLQLFREIRSVRGQLHLLKIPCYCFQSKHDEMVSMRAVELLKQNEAVNVSVLEHSSHFYYNKSDYDFLLAEFQKLMK